MPGRGCQARKAERRQLRKQAANEANLAAIADMEDLEPAAKLLKLAAIAADAEAGVLPSAPVPTLDELSPEDKAKADELCRALCEACLGFGSDGCSVPQLGSHWKVQSIRKEKCFNHMRLADLIRRHADVFDVQMEEGIPGGWRVKLQPDALTTIPGLESLAVSSDSGVLPPLIEAPQNPFENLQAMRIHTVHALFKRGGKAMLHDLGQDPEILKLRGPVLNGRSLLQFVKVFRMNFDTEDLGNGNFMISLKAPDVSDMSMIPNVANEFSSPVKGRGEFKGKGKGKKGPTDPMSMLQLMKGKATAKGLMKGNEDIGDLMPAFMMMKGMMFAKGMMGKGPQPGKGSLEGGLGFAGGMGAFGGLDGGVGMGAGFDGGMGASFDGGMGAASSDAFALQLGGLDGGFGLDGSMGAADFSQVPLDFGSADSFNAAGGMMGAMDMGVWSSPFG